MRAPEARSRRFLAAAHVVCDPSARRLDWEVTLAYRRHLWSLGLGVAEAMDTAQRGGALAWPDALELIRRSAAEARSAGGELVAGVTTDQLGNGVHDLAAIERAYREQCELVQDAGAAIVIMPSRQLASAASGPDDYRRVYASVLRDLEEPAILHWLGAVFAPALEGYWGCEQLGDAGDVVLSLIHDHPGKVDGIKLSVLDADFEVALRRRLPEGVRMFTGDDLNYPELIRGDEHGHSDALLGVFDAIAPAAAAALAALDEGHVEGYNRALEATLPLARHVFAPPVESYKVGLVFLAYLNGHQPHFRMLGALEGARSAAHLAETFRLAREAGLLTDPELASDRMARVMAPAGVT